jgi:hypothetical protein
VWEQAWQAARPFFMWAEETWLGESVRDSVWAFAVLEVVHLWGLTILLGSLFVVYLRVAGFGFRNQSPGQVARQFAPWNIAGLSVMVVSGGSLFVSEAMKCWESEPFRLKMTLFLPAVMFHFALTRRIRSDRGRDLHPVLRKLAAGFAGMLWLGVGIAGRWIGYY